MKKISLVVLSFLLFSMALKAADNQDAVVVKGNDKNLTVECDDRNVIVTGVNNVVRITGVCRNLTVSGSNHEVVIETVSKITVSGSKNRVWWKAVNGKRKRPRISKSGFNNLVKKFDKKKNRKEG